MHERFTRFMNGISASLEMRRSMAVTSPELRGASVFEHLMGVALVIVVMVALIEPASTIGLNLLSRLTFFALHLFPATAAGWFLSGWLFNSRFSRRVPPWGLLVIAGAMTGLFLAPISVTLELLFGVLDVSDPHAKVGAMTLSNWLAELAIEFTELPWTTAIAWPAMNVLVIWRVGGSMARDWRSADVTPAQLPAPLSLADSIERGEPATAPPPSEPLSKHLMDERLPGFSRPQTGTYFLDRLPRHLGRDIVYLEAQEHYLRVVTSRGEHLLLQGLTHAIAELERSSIEGIQIHRSVWVAWKHVRDVDARLNSLSVKLSNETSLRLGRRRAKEVLAAWARRQNADDKTRVL